MHLFLNSDKLVQMRLSLIFLILFSNIVFAQDWVKNAKRLSGESEWVKKEAIRKLKSTPNLETLLRAQLKNPQPALTTHPALVLDVISTLKMKGLIPDLMQWSQNDEAGFSYLALNSLIAPSNQKEIITLYSKRISEEKTSVSSKMILLDSLGRMRIKLKFSILEKLLLRESSPEVKSAALYYLRSRLVTEKDQSYLSLLTEFQAQKPSKNAAN